MMLSKLYRLATDLAAPFVGAYLRRRRSAGKEDAARFQERFGHSSRPRPPGRLVWCHAASVGEAASLLLLIDKIHDVYPDVSILLTTGTVTAAKMMMPRLPGYAVHQYMPVDIASCVTRFLDHWTPTLVLFTESEIWPNILLALRARAVPVVLLNARMSDKSFRNWHRIKGWARELMGAYSLCLAQTEDDRGRFIALGASPVKCMGNLKYAASPLPVDDAELFRLRADIDTRPLWLMASTHRGEEEITLTVHRSLSKQRADLLTVVAPRHAARGDEIAAYLTAAGMRVSRRSRADKITADTQIYLADTMGELGLLYRLCPITLLGGSFARIGGHNPIEAALLSSAVIFGPVMYNFSEIAREFVAVQGATQVQHANEVPFVVERMLSEPHERMRQAQTARLLADQKRHILDQIIAEMTRGYGRRHESTALLVSGRQR